MAKKRTKAEIEKHNGPHPHQLNYEKLDVMIGLMATGEECCGQLEIDYETMDRALKRDGHGGFKEYFKKKCAKTKISLRRAQFRNALDGNTTMQIWLGKQYLDQTDKNETYNDGPAPTLVINYPKD